MGALQRQAGRMADKAETQAEATVEKAEEDAKISTSGVPQVVSPQVVQAVPSAPVTMSSVADTANVAAAKHAAKAKEELLDKAKGEKEEAQAKRDTLKAEMQSAAGARKKVVEAKMKAMDEKLQALSEKVERDAEAVRETMPLAHQPHMVTQCRIVQIISNVIVAIGHHLCMCRLQTKRRTLQMLQPTRQVQRPTRSSQMGRGVSTFTCTCTTVANRQRKRQLPNSEVVLVRRYNPGYPQELEVVSIFVICYLSGLLRLAQAGWCPEVRGGRPRKQRGKRRIWGFFS